MGMYEKLRRTRREEGTRRSHHGRPNHRVRHGNHHDHHGHHHGSGQAGWCAWEQPVVWLDLYRVQHMTSYTLMLRPRKTLSFKTSAWPTRLGSVNSTYAYLHTPN